MKKLLTISGAVLLATGCTTPMTDKVDQNYQKNESMMTQLIRAQQIANGAEDTATNKVSTVYLGAKSIPLKTDLVLPEVFRIPKNFRYPNERFTLAQAIARISADTGIPIRIAADVYTPPRTTRPGAAAAAATAPTAALGGAPGVGMAVPPLRPTAGGAPATGATTTGSVTLNADSLNSITLNVTDTPAEVLNQICTLNGLHWEFRDGVGIVQRLITRNFTLKILANKTAYSFARGKTGNSTASSSTATGGTGGIQTGFTSNSNVTRTDEGAHPMDEIRTMIEAVLTDYGSVVASKTTGTIMVSDTIDGIDRAAKIIDRQNEIYTRGATFKIEIVTFKQNDNDQVGVDWNVLFQNFGKFGATITSPTSIVNATGGSIGLQVLTPAGGRTGRFDGSQAFLKLLNEIGTANTLHTIDVRTRNRNMTSASTLTQTVYLARTTPASSAPGSTGGVPGLEPGTVTTGLDLKLQPNILDSNQISLLFSVGLVDLINIATITSGQGANQQSVEAPQTSGFEFEYDVNLQPGVTAILSGYERAVFDYTKRTLGRDVSLFAGGSFNGKANNEKIFILITPTVVGSAF